MKSSQEPFAVERLEMAGIDEVQLRADDDYAFEGDIADDSEFQAHES